MNLIEIDTTLNRYLLQLPNAPPIVFDNAPARERPQNQDGVMLEAVNLPNTVSVVDFCHDQRSGIYSINILTNLEHGVGVCLQWAQAIENHFKSFSDADFLNHDDRFVIKQINTTRIGRIEQHFAYNVSITWQTLESVLN